MSLLDSEIDQIVSDTIARYFAESDQSTDPNPLTLFAAAEIITQEIGMGNWTYFQRSLVSGFSVAASTNGQDVLSISDRHEFASAVIQLARKIVESRIP